MTHLRIAKIADETRTNDTNVLLAVWTHRCRQCLTYGECCCHLSCKAHVLKLGAESILGSSVCNILLKNY